MNFPTWGTRPRIALFASRMPTHIQALGPIGDIQALGPVTGLNMSRPGFSEFFHYHFHYWLLMSESIESFTSGKVSFLQYG